MRISAPFYLSFQFVLKKKIQFKINGCYCKVILIINLSGVKYGDKSIKLGDHVLHYVVKLISFNLNI